MSRNIFASGRKLAQILTFAVVGSAVLAGTAASQNILFYGPSVPFSRESTMASNLNYTVTVASVGTWANMTTADFAQFDAIAFGDASCDLDPSYLSTAEATKAVWSAAVARS